MTPKALDLRDRLLVARLPAMPQILTRLLWLCNEEDVNLADLAALASHDPGVAARILSVANSAAYYHGGRRLSLDQALGILGLDLFKSLVIGQSVLQVFNQFAGAGMVDLRLFWSHSLRSAVLARELAVCAGYSRPDEAYLAGLLHDVGRLALMSTAPREYAPLFAAADDDQVCVREAATLELTHTEAGAWLAERWQFDALLADSILYHHEPAHRLVGTHPLLCLTALAHRLAEQPAADADADAAALAAACGISAAALAGVLPVAAVQGRRVADALGIDLVPVTANAPTGGGMSPASSELAAAVRDIALAQDARGFLLRHESETAIVDALVQSTGTLFAVPDVVFLRHDVAATAFVGVAAGRLAGGAPEIRVPLVAGGVLSEAVSHGQLLRLPAGSDAPGVGEARLLRLLGTPTLLALPLSWAGHCRGLLVLGCSLVQAALLETQQPLLQLFARQAAQVLADSVARADLAAARIAEVGEQHRLAVRKLVHEVNNPLAIIRNYLFLLESKLSGGEAPADEVAVLGEEVERVARLVGRMGVAKMEAEAGVPAGMSVGPVVRQAVGLFERSGMLGGGTVITVDLPDDLPRLPGDPDCLRQIVDNLLKNAVEAMPGGGRISVASNGQVNRGGRAYLELLVRDSGPGMPPAVLAHLFSPVASAKGAGHGLGLSVVHDLVTRLGGGIQCRSTPSGTTFEIQLPLPASEGP